MPDSNEPDPESLPSWLRHPPTPQRVVMEILEVGEQKGEPVLMVKVGVVDSQWETQWVLSWTDTPLERVLDHCGHEIARAAQQLIRDMSHYRALKWGLPAQQPFLALLALEQEISRGSWQGLYQAWGGILAISNCWAGLRGSAMATWRPGCPYRVEVPL